MMDVKSVVSATVSAVIVGVISSASTVNVLQVELVNISDDVREIKQTANERETRLRELELYVAEQIGRQTAL